MEQRANIKFYVKLSKTFTETLVILREAYGDKVLWATYETLELIVSVEKLRRANTKIVRLQKSKVKIMLIVFYNSRDKIRLLMKIITWALWSVC